jgi:hypothetical protein
MNQQKQLLKLVRDYGRFVKEHKFDPFHNFYYREVFAAELFSRFTGLECEQSPGDHGFDLISGKYNGEAKSGKWSFSKKEQDKLIGWNRKSFQFDKQNDKDRRLSKTKADFYIFSGFSNNDLSKIIFSFIFMPKTKGTKALKKEIKRKQNEFLELLKENKKQGKQLNRDTISFSPKELFPLLFGDDYAIILGERVRKEHIPYYFIT